MALSTSNLLGNPVNLNNIGSTLSTASPAQTALTNKINPAPLQQPTALKTTAPASSTSTAPAPLTASQLNQIAQGSGFQGGSFSSTGLPATPQTSIPTNVQSSTGASPLLNNIGGNNSGVANPNGQGTLPITNPNPQPNPTAPTAPPPQTAPTNSGLLTQIQQGASQPSQAYLDSVKQAEDYNQQLTQSRQNEANALALNAQNPIPLEFQQGRGQVLQNQYTQQQAALGAGFQGASNLVGAANTQQQTQQAGLLGAAGLTYPTSQFGVLTNPQTGQPISGGVGGNTPGQAAYYGGQIAGQQQAGANSVATAQAIAKAQPIASNLDTLISQNDINPTDVTWANGLLNFLRTNVGSDPKVVEFGGQVNDLAQTLAPALGVPGGATTDFKTQLGQSIVNGLQNGQSVSQAIQYFITQAQQGAQGAQSGALNPNATIQGNSGATGVQYNSDGTLQSVKF